MATYRVQHSKNNPYVILNKGFLEDARLSAKAKGILSYLLSRPDGWKVRLEQLITVFADGRDSIKSGLKELEINGYFSRTAERDPVTGKIIEWVHDVYESPVITSDTDTASSTNQVLQPETGLPHVAHPHVVNPPLLINKKIVITEREKDPLSVITRGQENQEPELPHVTGNKKEISAANHSTPLDKPAFPARDNKHVEQTKQKGQTEPMPNWAYTQEGNKWIAKPEFVSWYAKREGLTAAKAINFLQKPSQRRATDATWQEYQEELEKVEKRERAKAQKQKQVETHAQKERQALGDGEVLPSGDPSESWKALEGALRRKKAQLMTKRTR